MHGFILQVNTKLAEWFVYSKQSFFVTRQRRSKLRLCTRYLKRCIKILEIFWVLWPDVYSLYLCGEDLKTSYGLFKRDKKHHF